MAMYEEQQKLVDQVIEQMEICANMLGAPDKTKESIYGFVPGLNEIESEKHLRERIKNISQGIFQVMFTGTFSAGKSTILNALMHTDVLATGILPETAVITKIIFESAEECVVIYKKELDENGQPVTIVMKDLPQFFKEYHVDREDTEKFHKIVDHVVIYQKSPGIAGSMVQLVDSPGTRASQADDKVALDFAEKADALVFVISALEPLDMKDKKYIAEHFANKQKENVFFVVNKVNLLNSDEDILKLKEYIKEELRDVFVDKNGVFNELLFEKRVFYVDAFGSMNTRRGMETPIARNYKVMIDDNTTGIPEFEDHLGAFLTAGNRDKAALSAYRGQMADFYMLADESKKNQLTLLRKGKDEIAKELDKFLKEKKKVEREIQDISNDIETTRRDILRDARDVYDSYAEAVEFEWKDYFADKIDGMGVHTVALLAAKAENIFKFWKDKDSRKECMDKKTEKATKEFKDGIESFMTSKSKEMEKQFEIKISSRLTELEENLDRHQENLTKMNIPVNVNELIKMLILDNGVDVSRADENNAKLGQALIAILLGDPELVVTAGGGKAGTIDFIVDIIKTNVIDVVLAAVLTFVFGNIVGIILFVVAKLVKAEMRGESMTEKLIEETMNVIINGDTAEDGTCIPGLKKDCKVQYIKEIELKIGGAMLRANKTLTTSVESRLSAVERQLSDAYTSLVENESVLDVETERMNKILDTFAKAVSSMSILTNGTSLTVDDIRSFSTQVDA